MINLNSKLILSFALFFLYGEPHAQEVIPAAGGNATGAGGSQSYTIGQIANSSYSSISGSISQGVQHAYEISISTEIESAKGISLSVFVFPNPTTDYLQLKVDNSLEINEQSLEYKLFDCNGKMIDCKRVNSTSTKIKISSYQSGYYILKLTDGDKVIKSFKILKK